MHNNVYMRIFITSVSIAATDWKGATAVNSQDQVLISCRAPSERNLVRATTNMVRD